MAEYRSPDLQTLTPVYNLPIKRQYDSPIGDAANLIAGVLPLLRKKGEEPTLPKDYYDEAATIIGESVSKSQQTSEEVSAITQQYQEQIDLLDQGFLPPLLMEQNDAQAEYEKEARAQASLNVYQARIADVLELQTQRGVDASLRITSLFQRMLSDPIVQSSTKVYGEAVNLWGSLTTAVERSGAKLVEDMPQVKQFREEEKLRAESGLTPEEFYTLRRRRAKIKQMEDNAAYLALRSDNTKADWESLLLDEVDAVSYGVMFEPTIDPEYGELPSIVNIVEDARRGVLSPQNAGILVMRQRDAAIRKIVSDARAIEQSELGKNNPIRIDTKPYEEMLNERYKLIMRYIEAENYAGIRASARQDALVPFFASLAIAAGFSPELGTETLAGIAQEANLAATYTKSVDGWAQYQASLINITPEELLLAVEKGSQNPKIVAALNEFRRQFVASGMSLQGWAEGQVPDAFKPGTQQFADVAAKIAGLINRTYVPQRGDIGWLHPFIQRTVGAMAESGAITEEQTAAAISSLIGVQFDINSPESLLLDANVLNNNSGLYTGAIGRALRNNPSFVEEVRDNAEPKLGNTVQSLSDSIKSSIVFDFNDPLGFSFTESVVQGRVGPQGRPGAPRKITAGSLPDPQLIKKLQGLHNLMMQILGPQVAINSSYRMAAGYGITIRNMPEQSSEEGQPPKAQTQAATQQQDVVVEQQVGSSQAIDIDSLPDILGQ